MQDSLLVKDNFLNNPELVRNSALAAGFGSWKPNKGKVGDSIYSGMCFYGAHAHVIAALSDSFGGKPVFPNAMFFRCLTKDAERAYVHSDREWGDWTCVTYLSEHKVKSGTGFYRHRKTGLTDMPPMAELDRPENAELKKDIVSGGSKEWEETMFVVGLFNRAVIFRAPLFHGRIPKTGIGNKLEDARMVHVVHFHIG